MSFRDDLARFSKSVEVQSRAVFVGAVAAAKTSIVDGSTLTGSPGQPVENEGPDKGNLRGSWQVEFPTPTSAIISTNVVYAESNEDGIARPGGGAYLLRADVGGRHSVQKTILGFEAIVASEAQRLGGGS